MFQSDDVLGLLPTTPPTTATSRESGRPFSTWKHTRCRSATRGTASSRGASLRHSTRTAPSSGLWTPSRVAGTLVRVRVKNRCDGMGPWSEALRIYVGGGPDASDAPRHLLRRSAVKSAILLPPPPSPPPPPPPPPPGDDDDGNNGHGNDDDHDDDSNPGGGGGINQYAPPSSGSPS